MRYILIYLLISISYFPIKLHGQDDYIVNQVKFLQKTNPSFYGMNQLNRVGVLYNSIKVNEKFKSVGFDVKNDRLAIITNERTMYFIDLPKEQQRYVEEAECRFY